MSTEPEKNVDFIALPPRSLPTADDVRRAAEALGRSPDVARGNAKCISACEWTRDLEWARDQQRALGLTDHQRTRLEDRLMRRNQEVWGADSQAA